LLLELALRIQKLVRGQIGKVVNIKGHINRSRIPHPSYVRLDMAVGSDLGVGLDAVAVPAVEMVPAVCRTCAVPVDVAVPDNRSIRQWIQPPSPVDARRPTPDCGSRSCSRSRPLCGSAISSNSLALANIFRSVNHVSPSIDPSAWMVTCSVCPGKSSVRGGNVSVFTGLVELTNP